MKCRILPAVLRLRMRGVCSQDYYEKPNYMEDGLGETETYWDARLTPAGEEQSAGLAKQVQQLQASGVSIDLVAVSPLTRAIQTASIGFASPRPPFVSTSLCRERVWTHQCDRRRSRAILEGEFPWVDFSQIQPGEDEMWDAQKENMPHPQNSTACRARGVRFLDWLWARPESSIAVVSHWMFLQHLFSHYPEDEELNANWTNAELRTVTLLRRSPEETPTGSKEEL